jgi:hypothetical protein
MEIMKMLQKKFLKLSKFQVQVLINDLDGDLSSYASIFREDTSEMLVNTTNIAWFINREDQHLNLHHHAKPHISSLTNDVNITTVYSRYNPIFSLL